MYLAEGEVVQLRDHHQLAPGTDNGNDQNTTPEIVLESSESTDSEEEEGWREGDLQEFLFSEDPHFTVPDDVYVKFYLKK